MTKQTPFILSFTAVRATDLALVGGKGANLGEMAHAGFPVPPGFCLTTAAFQQYIDACPDAADLYASLNTVTPDDVETARDVGQQVRQTLLVVAIPEGIVQAVRQQWQQVGTDYAYAVRSSATAEDLPMPPLLGNKTPISTSSVKMLCWMPCAVVGSLFLPTAPSYIAVKTIFRMQM